MKPLHACFSHDTYTRYRIAPATREYTYRETQDLSIEQVPLDNDIGNNFGVIFLS